MYPANTTHKLYLLYDAYFGAVSTPPRAATEQSWLFVREDPFKLLYLLVYSLCNNNMAAVEIPCSSWLCSGYYSEKEQSTDLLS